MKRITVCLWILAVGAAPAAAERIVLSPDQIELRGLKGAVLGPLQSVGGAHGVSGMTADMTAVSAGRTLNGPGHVYDNVPTFLGGAGTTGGLSFAFVDWESTTAYWMDFVQLTVPATLRQITYYYIGTSGGAPAGPATHSIMLRTGDVAPPPGVSGPFVGVGAPLVTLVLPSMPGTFNGGFVSVVAYFPGVPVATTGLYVGFDEGRVAGGGPVDSVFWLSGGAPGIGHDSSDFVYWLPSGPYSDNVPGILSANFAARDNITLALGTIPEPGTIVLLAAGGLLVLRRRRAA